MVDGKHCLQHIHKDHNSSNEVVSEAVQQIAFADRILLNKMDLISEQEKTIVKQAIRGINSQAAIIECSMTQGPPDLESILGLQAFDLDRLLEADPGLLLIENGIDGRSGQSSASHTRDCSDSNCQHEDHKHRLHGHSPGVSSVAIEMEGQLQPQAINRWLGDFLQERGPDLYRSKGILHFAGEENRTVFQGVHNMWQFSKLDSEPLGDTDREQLHLNKLVFIGLNLDRESLTESLKACLANPSS